VRIAKIEEKVGIGSASGEVVDLGETGAVFIDFKNAAGEFAPIASVRKDPVETPVSSFEQAERIAIIIGGADPETADDIEIGTIGVDRKNETVVRKGSAT
jgi:hypothetical protein